MGDGLGALCGSNSLADRVIQTEDTVLVDANLVEPEDSRNGGCKRGVEKRSCRPGVFVSTVCESATGTLECLLPVLRSGLEHQRGRDRDLRVIWPEHMFRRSPPSPGFQ